MAKAKTPRSTSTTNHENKQVITMPEGTTAATTRKLTKTTPAASTAVSPTPIDIEAQIRQRAYELYQDRGYVDGHENEDWLQAEKEIRGHLSRSQSA